MWHALRAELSYSLPFLLGGLGIASLVVIIISVVFLFDDSPPDFAVAGLRGMFMIMAPLIVGFIIQAYRHEERRTRLLLAGSLTPRQLAGATALLSVILFGIGVVAAGLVIGVGFMVSGRLALESLNIVGFVGGQMFSYTQLGLLMQETIEARNQQRPRAAAAGWAGFVLAVLLIAIMYVVLAMQLLTWNHLVLGHLVIAVMAMAASMEMYTGRTSFTR